MAVSKNKRKNDTKQQQQLRTQRMKQRVQSGKLNKKYKEAQQMAVIIKESLKDFNELKEVNNTLYETLTNVVQKFKDSDYDEDVEEETRKRLDNEIELIEGIIQEGKEVSKACEASFEEMVKQVESDDFDPIDVNMNVINEFMSIKEHQEYLCSKADTLRKACNAKSKSIDINELNTILD